jgi:hypothetical protein
MDTLTELQRLKQGYQSALSLLKKYNSDPSSTINIPITSVAFVQGKLKNPNSIFIYLSPELTLKSDLQGCETIINQKLSGTFHSGLEKSIQDLQPPEQQPIEKLFEKLKILEEQENSTLCLGSIVEKQIKASSENSKETIKPKETIETIEKTEEAKLSLKPSRFKQEMLEKRRN